MRAKWLRAMAEFHHSNCGDRDAGGAPNTMRFHAFDETTLKSKLTVPEASYETALKPKLIWQAFYVQRYSGTESAPV